MKLDTQISELKGIGPKQGELFNHLEIETLRDFIFKFPRKYLDLADVVAIADLSFDLKKTFRASVKSFRNVRLRGGGKTLQTAVLTDESTQITAIWFNQPFLETSLIPGVEYYFVGKLSHHKKTGKVQLSNPVFDPVAGDNLHSARIVPVYKLTKGLSPKVYRRRLKGLLDSLDVFPEDELSLISESVITTVLSSDLAAKLEVSELLGISEALAEIHFPESFAKLGQAQLRLALEELLPVQLKLMAQAKIRAQAQPRFLLAETAKDFENLFADYWRRFEFPPTDDQEQACRDILADFAEGRPAYRLIQGDVGTGKTAVAGFALYLSLLHHKDSILMVPTTVLANQHYSLFFKLFPGEIELVTGDVVAEKPHQTRKPKSQTKHTPRIYIGTQAILHRYPQMNLDLGVLIIDEEHRFGVAQREQIQKLAKLTGGKNSSLPHYLSLTATPIPRSLTLSIFGQMAMSIISTKPAQQLPKITYLVPPHKVADSYKWIHEQIKAGTQVFWICPLIEEEKETDETTVIYERSEKATVTATYKKLVETFPDLRIQMLHGKLADRTKTKILDDFKAGEFDILVSTTVIEVGIDIPKANVIAIESPERFGLAQLHQLRGRVGRGEKQGYCLLLTTEQPQGLAESPSEAKPVIHPRLKFFSQETDGLKLAEFDLKTRGPGEVYGTMQSGVPNFQVADITNPTHMQLSKLIAEMLFNHENN